LIIGNGLLARAFSASFESDESVCVFASGVSNSRETNDDAFARERALLSATLAQEKFVVYFSTCSVHDPELKDSSYVRHKREMEQMVQEGSRMAIFRLPQVVGHTLNPHTLVNYLYHQISTRSPFHVWLHARRNLIDVSDVAAIATYLIRHRQSDCIITNIACPFSVAIPELVRIFENVLNIHAIWDTVDAGASYEIDTSLTIETAAQIGVNFDQHYVKNLIQKYYA
jgi:nucleoside-diphosphate-sugar epimerase